jgi:uncharacterized protein involved in exopolysaccharide biosynthesis/Mrp family chromosome partitioning ATPase
MNLSYILKVLWNKKWIIVGATVLATLLSIVFTLKLKKVYKSTTLISTGYTFEDEVNLDGKSASLFDINNKFNNLIELLNSPLIVNMLSYNLLIHDLEKPSEAYTQPDEQQQEKINALGKSKIEQIKQTIQNRLSNLELLTTNFDDNQDLLDLLEAYEYDFKSLTKNLYIRRVNQSDYISIEFKSSSASLSEFAVNTISNECIRYNYYLTSNRSGAAVAYLEKMVKQAQETVAEKSDKLVRFKSQKNIHNYKAESEKHISQASEYENKLLEEQKKIQAFQISIADLDKQIEENAGTGSNNNSKIFELRKKIDILNDKYVSTGSKDKAVSEQLNNLREQLYQEIAKQPSKSKKTDIESLQRQKQQLELDLKIARANIESINQALGNAKYNISNKTNHEDSLAVLENDIKVANDNYALAIDRLTEARKSTNFKDNTLRIVIYGQASKKPESSKRLIIIAISLIVGLMLSTVSIVLIEAFDMSIKSPIHFSKEIPLHLLGHLNEIKLSKSDLLKILNDKNKNEPIEKYNQLLKNIRIELENSQAKTLLISSLKKGEGKSTVALATAQVFAVKNKKVLIIDLNFKHNSLSNQWVKTKSESNNPYLLDVLSINTHIDLMACKQTQLSPLEIKTSAEWAELLLQCKNKYDLVLIETPNLSEYADTKELVSVCDGLCLVMSAESIINESDKPILDYVSLLGSKFKGVVLNKVNQLNLS